MKKILICSIIAAIAFASCNKLEDEIFLKVDGAHAFEAGVELTETKTIIDGLKSYWNGTESIWILNGLTSGSWKKKYKTTVTKQEKAIFVEDVTSTTLSGDDFLAIYPSEQANDATWSGQLSDPMKKCWLEGVQSPVVGSYDPATHIAVAYTESGNEVLNFKNIISLVKFTLKSSNVSEVCFYGNNSDIITGNFDVKYNEGNPIVTKQGTNYTLNSYVKVEGTLTKDKIYYMSVLPTEFSKGFSVEMVAYGAKGTLKCSDSYSLRRNQILDLGNITWTPDADAVLEWTKDTQTLQTYWGDVSYLYVWTDDSKYPLGVWPGKKMTWSNNKFSAKIPKEYIGKKLNFKVHNNNGWEGNNQVMNPVWASQSYKGNANFGLK